MRAIQGICLGVNVGCAVWFFFNGRYGWSAFNVGASAMIVAFLLDGARE